MQVGWQVSLGNDGRCASDPATADHRLSSASSSSLAIQPMIARLDDVSRKTIARFILKIAFGIFFATMSKGSFLLAASEWFSLYALLTAIVGIFVRERIANRSFNHWDEALWLTALALILKILH